VAVEGGTASSTMLQGQSAACVRTLPFCVLGAVHAQLVMVMVTADSCAERLDVLQSISP